MRYPKGRAGMNWLHQGNNVIAASIVFATLFFGWMFRYERISAYVQVNRFTGAFCSTGQECWLHNGK
jgi:hypothetical protein